MRLDGEDLIWREFSDQYPGRWPRYVGDTEGALDAFLEVENAAGVQSFARSFGPLFLCGHLLPQSHKVGCRPTRREPVSRWLELVRHARAIIDIASQMRRALHGRRQDWEELYAGHRQADGRFPEDLENLIRGLSGETRVDLDWTHAQWMQLKQELDWWIRIANVRPEISVDWNGRAHRPPIELAGAGVWGVLSVQLLAAVAGAHEVYFCQACGKSYVPARQPQRGRRHYCNKPECKALGARLRKRDQLARRRSRSRAKDGGSADR